MEIKEAIEKSLFFFGAGVSFDAGCKLSSDMLDDLHNRIVSNVDETFDPVQKETLRFLLSSLQFQSEWRNLEVLNDNYFNPNIEELALVIRRVKNRENFLPYPLTGNWADKLILLENEFHKHSIDGNLFDSIEMSIKNKLIPEWMAYSSLDYLSPIASFLEQNNDDLVLEIVSLNYDMVIEHFFEKRNMPPWRGFSNNIWVSFNGDVPVDFGRIHLYKIHGSVDWVRLTSGEARINKNLTPIELENIDEKHNPYVVFGQGSKSFSVDPFFSLIHNFKSLLQKKNYIFVIGYSFFDPYINNLLIEAANMENKKIVIVNPFFGPNGLCDSLKGNLSADTFFEGKDKNGSIDYKLLISYIENIQRNSYYSEIPEFNISVISGDSSLFYMPIGFSQFLNTFFPNNGRRFTELIDKFEEEAKINTPF